MIATSILTKAYKNFFESLHDKNTYRTYSVAEYYCDNKGVADSEKRNVILRIDVDSGLHLCVPLAKTLKNYGYHATFYFLTHPDQYYNIWGSGIPRKIAQLGFEVGIHSDHYYEQIVKGIDGLSKLKTDIRRLADEAGVKIRGMTHHGHPEIDRIGKRNWDLTKDIPSQDLGLDYHDGLLSCYIKPGSKTWTPKCDILVSDFMGFSNSWGWNYYPRYPLRQLKKAKPCQVVHVTFHIKNTFEYWRNWDESFDESSHNKENPISYFYKSTILKLRYGLLRGYSFKHAILKAGFKLLTIFFVKGIGMFWPRPQIPEPDTSWETGRKRIYDLGIPYWRNHLETLGMTAPGGKVLEVGSGNGQWLIAYAQDSAEVVGLEPWRPIREYSLKKLLEYQKEAKKIKILEGVAESIPFPDGYFDRVLCAGVFMFTFQDLAFKEMERVLKPGGKLCLIVNGLGYFIMNILDGFRYKSVNKMSYGLGDLIATLAKWWFKKDFSVPKAVNYKEIKRLCTKYSLKLYEKRVFLSQDLYPKKHLGFPTNYAFLIKK